MRVPVCNTSSQIVYIKERMVCSGSFSLSEVNSACLFFTQIFGYLGVWKCFYKGCGLCVRLCEILSDLYIKNKKNGIVFCVILGGRCLWLLFDSPHRFRITPDTLYPWLLYLHIPFTLQAGITCSAAICRERIRVPSGNRQDFPDFFALMVLTFFLLCLY